MSDEIVRNRKQKNAQGQASYRAKRNAYTATLEQTVTLLESNIVELQNTLRELQKEAEDMRCQNRQLEQEMQESNRVWKAEWEAYQSSQLPATKNVFHEHVSTNLSCT